MRADQVTELAEVRHTHRAGEPLRYSRLFTSGNLHRHQVSSSQGRVSGPLAATEVLRPRSSFERMDVLVAQARRSVLILGVNLEGAMPCVSTLLDLARLGGMVRLAAMDPAGVALGPAAVMSGVDPAIRRQKIIQNLELLRTEFDARLDTEARASCLTHGHRSDPANRSGWPG